MNKTTIGKLKAPLFLETNEGANKIDLVIPKGCYIEVSSEDEYPHEMSDLDLNEAIEILASNKKTISHLFDVSENFYIAQKEKYGCSLACMAMLLNIQYSDIRKLWPNNKEGVKSGIGEYKRTSFLFKHGFIGHTEYATEAYTQRKRDRAEWIKPFAPVHIVGCITDNGPHALIWLKDGRVYDPNSPGIHMIDEYKEIYEITGYWIK